jgi:5-methylcytosine-specific restriction endonuclease McrA
VGDGDLLVRVALRDEFRCGLCGRPVDMALSRLDPQGPSLDHVVPLNPVPGEPRGDHSMGNLHLAHRVCNGRKQNRQPSVDLVSAVLARQAAWESGGLDVAPGVVGAALAVRRIVPDDAG